MITSKIERALTLSSDLKVKYRADTLRLRPNYLVYSLETALREEQREFLRMREIPWVSYEEVSVLVALCAFLKDLRGGLYLPRIEDVLIDNRDVVYLFLLDPHLIGDFEAQLGARRLGVLLRRPILATLNFKEIVEINTRD